MEQVIWNNLDKTQQQLCLQRPVFSGDITVKKNVTAIINDVRQNGDRAVREYTRKFDRVDLNNFRVTKTPNDLDTSICKAIDQAYQNIRIFHEQQGLQDYAVETMPGVLCQRIIRPIKRVGLYVPGGSAPLVSTALMLGVPAQLAGPMQITLCTPCNEEGNVNPYILYAAKLCGIENIFRIGGAQAIAAMAYGTKTVPKSDRIFGPGNAYVTEAKIQVACDPQGAAIDLPAGPSEVCVIADNTTNPAFAAADLLSQAEHDPLSQVVLIALSEQICADILQAVKEQLQALPRQEIVVQALEQSIAIIAADMNEALDIANQYASEHLILCFEGAETYLDQIKNAGSVFLGPWTPEAVGDYASGTNHVLPTYGYARTYSGLGVESFQKTMSVQQISRAGLNALGPTVEKLATLEGLDAHANAVSLRLGEPQ